MSLHEWCQLHDVTPSITEAGVSLILRDPPADLWNLRDYAVSTVSGPVVWMVRRTKARPVTML
jgi:hypothetical protein